MFYSATIHWTEVCDYLAQLGCRLDFLLRQCDVS